MPINYEEELSCEHNNFAILQIEGTYFQDYMQLEQKCSMPFNVFKKMIEAETSFWKSIYNNISLLKFNQPKGICLLIAKNIEDNQLATLVNNISNEAKKQGYSIFNINNMATVLKQSCFEEIPSNGYTTFKITKEALNEVEIYEVDSKSGKLNYMNKKEDKPKSTRKFIS